MKTMIRLKGTVGRVPQPASKQRPRGTGAALIESLAREKEHHREEADDRREAPKGMHGLIAGPGERLDQGNRCDRTAERPEHRGAPDLFPRRQPRKLHLYEVEIV